MEFDWINPSFDLKNVTPKDIEEAFEDPYCIKIFPDTDDENNLKGRYFLLGNSLENRYIFCCFKTDGKSYRVLFARDMSKNEESFYDRTKAEID